MKKLLILILCLLALIPSALGEEIRLVHATDLHYLSPTLTDGSSAFMEIISQADGKVTHYTPQLTRAFVADMLALRPNAVILTGDLTLNGAEVSHRELAALLEPLAKAGIPVLALSGNHDSGGVAYTFTAQGAEAIWGLEDEQIDDCYAHLGYESAFSRDESSMSYAARITPTLWCLLIDVNANGTSGSVNPGTLEWLEGLLLQAQAEDAVVITATHQTLLTHNKLFTFGYTLNNSGKLLPLYEQYQLPLNLCGHLHVQHIAQSGHLTEIAGSSLAVSPNQYGLLTFENGKLTQYETRSVDVAGWAAAAGETDPNLLNFAAYSAAFFDSTTRGQLEAALAETGLPPADQQALLAFAVRVNREYFAGARQPDPEDAALLALWQEHLPAAGFGRYLQSILAEPVMDMTRLP